MEVEFVSNQRYFRTISWSENTFFAVMKSVIFECTV
ncbi:UNVERIFIED_CONTAM: hypothetical protein ABIC26_002811 [Paenibacillus sp. PvR008]